jgi:hypothetical protein
MVPPSDSEFTFDVFISHAKKAEGTEDRALWCVDVFEEAGMKAFFDLQNLEEISSEQLVKDVKASKAVVTVCFHSSLLPPPQCCRHAITSSRLHNVPRVHYLKARSPLHAPLADCADR